MITVGIINYGIGNISSIKSSISRLGYPVKLVTTENDIKGVSTLILPGVGAMPFAMKNIRELKLHRLIKNIVKNKDIRLIGICLGMQMMFEFSEEGNIPCLGILKGRVKKFEDNSCHIGWNNVKTSLLSSTDKRLKNFYFNHSFYVECSKALIYGESTTKAPFPAIIKYKNFIGIQFHPEKSQIMGNELMKELII